MVTTRSQTKKKAEEDNKNVEDENVDNITETKPKKETKKQSKSKKVSNDDYLSMMANEDVDAPVPDEKPKKKSTKKDEKKDDKATDEDQKPEPKKSEKKKKPEPKKKTVESDDEYVADIAPKKKAVKKEPATKGGKKKSNQDDYLQQMYQEQDELELNDEEREKAVSLHDIDQMIDKEGLDSDEEPVKKKKTEKKQPVEKKKEEKKPEPKKKEEPKPKKESKEKKEEPTISKRKQKEEQNAKRKKKTDDDDFLDSEFKKLNPNAVTEEEEVPKPKPVEKKQEKKKPQQPKQEEKEDSDIEIESLDDDMEEVERIQVDSGKLLLVSGMATGALFGIIFAIVGATKMINMVGKYAYALSPVFSLILAFVGGFGSRSSVRAGNGPDASDLQSYGLIGLLTIFLFALVAVAKLLGPYFSVTRMVKRFKPKKVEKKEEPKPTFVRKVKEIQKKQNQDNDEDTASVESDDEFESD